MVPVLDAMDRAQLSPMDALLLLHVAEADATIVDLANRLERRPADVRRATGRLVARGLLRRRAESAASWGLVFTPTASGLDLLGRVGLPFASAGDGDDGRPAREAQVGGSGGGRGA
jgi:DNA-binding MarR family transcriptional regulator